MNEQQVIDTVIASLRLYQEYIEDNGRVLVKSSLSPYINEIAGDEPLTSEEIDDLIERIQSGDIQLISGSSELEGVDLELVEELT